MVLCRVRLVRVATKQAATDPRTGTIDMDLITTGQSASDRGRLAMLTERVRDHLENMREPSTRLKRLGDKLQEGASIEVRLDDLRRALSYLSDEGVVLVRENRNDPSNPTVHFVGGRA